MSTASPLIIQHLQKSYGALHVVNDLSLQLNAGECYGLLGPNGAGKTTTLRCCLGLTSADSGRINMVGLDVPEFAREARMKVGIVPQFDNLDPDFTCAENLIVFGKYFGLRAADVRAQVPRLMAFAGLEGKENANIRSLSGGMKRRLTLARALVNNPDLLILDEPTTGLDPQARHLIWERLKQLLAEGKTILLTTHFMDEAERLCDRLAIVDHGKMITEGVPAELIAQAIEPSVVEVFGDGVEDWAKHHAPSLAARVEVAGETAFCYVDDASTLLAHLKAFPTLRTLHRPANLEDLFIKLTGRELRD